MTVEPKRKHVKKAEGSSVQPRVRRLFVMDEICNKFWKLLLSWTSTSMVIQIQRNSIISTPTRRYLTVCRLLEPWFQSCRSDCRFLVWFACDDPSLERPRRWLDNKTKSRIDCLQKIVCILKQRSSSDAVFVSPLSNSLDCIACQDMAHSVELTKLADAKETYSVKKRCNVHV